MQNIANNLVCRWQECERNYDMSIEKKIARIISVLFHPLLMPSVGLLILFNSGTYLSLISFDVKKIILLIVILSTLVFPVTLLLILYFRRLLTDIHMNNREERFLPFLLILILYILTFIFMIRLPLHSHLHAYALTLPVLLIVLVIANIKYKISEHMMGLGGIVGLIISLIILFDISLQGFFVIAVLAAGITATARIIIGKYALLELYGGFVLGLVVTVAVMLIY